MSNDALPRRGLMLVLSSPSGAGKTTISRALLDGDDALELSVSATTRTPREGEVDGVHYHFVEKEKFLSMKKKRKNEMSLKSFKSTNVFLTLVALTMMKKNRGK